jgi:hypothetical protein
LWELKKYDQVIADNKGAEFYPMFQGSCWNTFVMEMAA